MSRLEFYSCVIRNTPICSEERIGSTAGWRKPIAPYALSSNAGHTPMNGWDSLDQAGSREMRLRSDLPFFCRECLRLRSKSGELIPFELNGAQLELHKLIEAQKERTGRVRVALLKARQLGCFDLHRRAFSASRSQ